LEIKGFGIKTLNMAIPFSLERLQDGALEIRRLDGRPKLDSIMISATELSRLNYTPADSMGMVLTAIKDYALTGSAIIPAMTADSCLPVVGPIIEASEAEVDAMDARRSANARWSRQYDSDLPEINVPDISVPTTTNLTSIVRGGEVIEPVEYLRIRTLFLLRGYREGEDRAFLGYWHRRKWEDGAIVGPEGRWNRAMRWQQMDGQRRFDGDPAAHELFRTLLSALPEDQRIYLLGDGIGVSFDGEGRLIAMVPAELAAGLQRCEAAKVALQEYCKSHNADTAKGWATIPICFKINVNGR